MRYELKSLVSFTWCPMTGGAPVLVNRCRECESLIKVIKLRDASDNIPLPSYVVRCKFPGLREILQLGDEEIVSCAKIKYSPYVVVPECEKCNFFVNRAVMKGRNGEECPAVLCSIPTPRTVAYKWKDFKAMTGGDES